MHSFTTLDVAWEVKINVGSIKRVKGLCEIDLLDAVKDKGELLGRLIDDPILLCNIIYALCEKQAVEKNITDEQFGEAMAGDALEKATTALLEEPVDFFPSRRREVLRAALEKMNQAQEKIADLALARLNDPGLDKQIDDAIEAAMGGVSGTISGDAPVSSE